MGKDDFVANSLVNIGVPILKIVKKCTFYFMIYEKFMIAIL